jgi:putative colanic acid biosynthesis UDP-glucose lipid carrier transferase
MIDPVALSFQERKENGILNPVFPVYRFRSVVDGKETFLRCKRAIDIIFSLLFIILILSWLLPLLFVLIRLNSRGPVFFLQKRVGFGGRIFTCYKLRTMSSSQQGDGSPLSVSRFEQFLRKTNLDEFPQFFNVLKGDMSLIGPRPHMLEDCRRFSLIIRDYKYRNMVKPGITGWAQINGYHGTVQSDNDIRMRYAWDIRYIREMNAIKDTSIFFRTIYQRIAGFYSALSGKSTNRQADYRENNTIAC